jgi:nucleotide-binding universal stress UspA family protein
MTDPDHVIESPGEAHPHLEAETGLIVVGVDGSPGAEHALRWALAEAQLRAARVKAVLAWYPPVHGSGLAEGLSNLEDPDVSVEPGGPAEQILDEVLERVQAESSHPVPVEGEAVLGHPAFSLLEAGADADLIVVGNRGRGGFRELLLGSTSHACAQHSRRPVAVIRPTIDRPGNGVIVVGADDSPGARRAVAWAAAEAARRGAPLVVVHAFATPAPLAPPEVLTVPIEPAPFKAEGVELLERVVDEALVDLPSVPEMELVTVDEPPARALLERAEHAELIVVGGRGRGGFMGLLLGSVSHQVLHHAPCAVAVVPDPRGDAPTA